MGVAMLCAHVAEAGRVVTLMTRKGVPSTSSIRGLLGRTPSDWDVGDRGVGWGSQTGGCPRGLALVATAGPVTERWGPSSARNVEHLGAPLARGSISPPKT